MKKISLDSFYTTSDLALVASITMHFPLDSLVKAGRSKVEFNFIRSKELDKIVELFWKGDLRVDPQSYFYNLKSLKTRIYEVS